MADTTNYGWTKPTVSGSSGAWGTILNTALDDVDANLKTVENKADAAQADATEFGGELLAHPLIHSAEFIDKTPNTGVTRNVGAGIGLTMSTAQSVATLIVPLRLRIGEKVTGFTSKGQAPTGTTVSVALAMVSNGDIVTAQSSHSHGTSVAEVSTTGIGYAPTATVSVVMFVTMQRTSGTGIPAIMWVKPTVERV